MTFWDLIEAYEKIDPMFAELVLSNPKYEREIRISYIFAFIESIQDGFKEVGTK